MAAVIKKEEILSGDCSFLSSWVSTITLLIVIIMALLGIKIWWFKHRLNFEQKPRLNIRTVKDIRQSQEVSHSITTQGVFRKRNEDEFDILQSPRQLPPVRIQERTTALLPLRQPSRTSLKLTEFTVSMQELPSEITEDRSMYMEEPDSIKEPILIEKQGKHSNDIAENSNMECESFAETITIENNNLNLNSFQKNVEIDLKDQIVINSAEVKNEVPVSKVQLGSLELNYNSFEGRNYEQDDFVTDFSWNNIYESEPFCAVAHNSIEVQTHIDSGSPHYEFEKIRHSFEQNEGHFLELNESLDEILQSPIGFGKNIDDDWENFEDLIGVTTLVEKSKGIEKELSSHFEDSFKNESQITYVKKIELYDELSKNDNDDIISTQNSPSILKAPQKSKKQHKVTFDAHTEEYFLTESDSYSTIGTQKMPIPTPMQRTTKIQYNMEHTNNDNSHKRKASTEPEFIQSTKILLDGPIEGGDSDSSIGTSSALLLNIQPAPRHALREGSDF